MSSHKDFVVAKKRRASSLAEPASAAATAPAPAPKKRRQRSTKDGGETALQKRRRSTAQSILSLFEPTTISSVSTADTSTSKVPVKQKPLVIDDDDDDDDDIANSDSTIDLTREQPAAAAATTTTMASTADSKQPRVTVNAWLGLIELARQTGLHSVTAVDPGTRNFALCRVEFYPHIRLTHVRVLDLNVLCQAMETADDTLVLRSALGYTIDAQAYALGDYIRREALAPNGCFNSSVVLIEEQSFSRDMARIEECVRATVNAVLPRRTLNACNKIPAGQLFSSRSVKSCYRPFFPDIDPSQIKRTYKSSSSSKRTAFGMGDSNRDSAAEQQRLLNKKNAIRFGQLILPQSELERVIPAANLTDFDRSRVLKAKSDDLYDTLFMTLYFGSSHLHHYAKLIRANTAETVSAFVSPPQRPLNCWEEVFEFCKAIGTPRENVEQLLAALMAYDTGSAAVVENKK